MQSVGYKNSGSSADECTFCTEEAINPKVLWSGVCAFVQLLRHIWLSKDKGAEEKWPIIVLINARGGK